MAISIESFPAQHDGISPEDEEHLNNLLAQVEPIDLLLQKKLQKMAMGAGDDRNFDSFLLAGDELDARTRELLGSPDWAGHAYDTFISPIIMQAEEDANNRLGQLFSRFGLTETERHILLLALLGELDARYHEVFGFLQGDPGRKWPGAECLVSLLCADFQQRSQLQRMLQSSAPLLRHRLVFRVDNSGAPTPNLHQGMIRIVPEVFHFLLGDDAMPADLQHFAHWLPNAASALPVQPAFTAQLVEFLEAHNGETLQLGLSGVENDSRVAALNLAAQHRHQRVLTVDFALLSEDRVEVWDALMTLLRETRLGNGLLLIRNLSEVNKLAAPLLPQFARRLLEEKQVVVVLQHTGSALDWLHGVPQMVLSVEKDSLRDSVAMLRASAARYAVDSAMDYDALLTRFTLNADSVDHVVQEADLYRQHHSDRDEINLDDFNKALRLRAQQNFGKLARRIEPVRSFEDLVASPELHIQLKEILAAIRQRGGVLNKGFDKKIVYGTGISALFYGDSGTGKSMAAEVLARALNVDLIKVDLSSVVNKYIGETEKNLAKVFDLATSDAGVLFFDEADALFGKRSEVKDAQDRHANIEVSYLLQRLESYPGLVVLATNNRSHLDQAFSRRLTFITRFTVPDAGLRERLWQQIWPLDIRVDADVNFQTLANRTNLTGANIRNIALLASWLAQDNNQGIVTKKHIDLALSRELSKLGRVI